MEFTAEQMARFKELVYDRSHLSFPRSREQQLRQFLAQRAKAGAYRSGDEYFQVLSSDDAEFAHLITLITTRETYFFRMPGQFEALRNLVLPAIAEREGKNSLHSLSRGERSRMKLRAWSAGCATGQEAYSLSMQVLDSLRYPRAWDIQVLGTDINATALATARIGHYDTTRLGQLPPRFRERYFQVRAPDEIAVSDEVKAITEFQVMNFRDLPSQASFLSAFDVIFCRNVMIYFDLAAQQGLITALTACLKPGGYLFTGEGEVLHLYDHELEVVEKDSCSFYRRPER